MSVFINGREVFNNSDINNPDIDGGTVDGTTIGASTPAAGAFTSVTTPAITATSNSLVIKPTTNATTAIQIDDKDSAVIVNVDTNGKNLGLGQTSFGTSAVRVLAIGSGTAPTTSPADAAQVWVQDETSAGGNARLFTRTEAGINSAIYTKAESAMIVREASQGIATTASASVGGIQVAHSSTYANTTNSFSMRFKGNLPSWTTATILKQKFSGSSGVKFEVVGTTGIFRVTINTKTYDSAVPGGGTNSNLVAGSKHEIVAVVSVGASTTTVSFYLDGMLLNTTAAQDNETISNSDTLYILGTSSVRYAGTAKALTIFNRALTAAEVLDLYRNGISESDKWGSQTERITSSDDRDFTNAGGVHWVDNNLVGTGGSFSVAAGKLDITSGAIYAYCKLPIAYITNGMAAGKRYRLCYDATITTGGWRLAIDADTGYYPGSFEAGTGKSIEFTLPDTATNVTNIRVQSTEASSSASFDNFSLVEIGATLALEPEGIQPAPGQWLDSSSNKLHAMQPATGSSLSRYKKDFEYRWTNTWTASSAAQYVGGLNQNILSADHFITLIVTQATVTTDVENLTLGDGSDADRFVAAFAPAATRTSQTIANQNDGTNLKLVYTPAAEATMTVETIIRGFIWEP